MKLLNAIFSYNRYYLLRNAVESLLEFGPDGDLLIVDDGSDDARVLEYLAAIHQEKRGVVMRGDHQDGFHGGLYFHMNRATEYAISHAYSHIFFIQDDVQFMWKDVDFLDRINDIFSSSPRNAMVFPMFLKEIVAPSLPFRLRYDTLKKIWYLHGYGICDIGIIPVALLQERKWKFHDIESNNSKMWFEWGYRLCIPIAPILAFVPWQIVHASTHRFGNEKCPSRRYFLKPLDVTQQEQLKMHNFLLPALHEDYCFPWGWRCLSPYWFTRGRAEYIKLLLRGIIVGKVRWPRWIQQD